MKKVKLEKQFRGSGTIYIDKNGNYYNLPGVMGDDKWRKGDKPGEGELVTETIVIVRFL